MEPEIKNSMNYNNNYGLSSFFISDDMKKAFDDVFASHVNNIISNPMYSTEYKQSEIKKFLPSNIEYNNSINKPTNVGNFNTSDKWYSPDNLNAYASLGTLGLGLAGFLTSLPTLNAQRKLLEQQYRDNATKMKYLKEDRDIRRNLRFGE